MMFTRRIAELIAIGLTLLIVLVLLDTPRLDTIPDPQVKQRRFPVTDNVFRIEGYSRYHINSHGLVGSEPRPLTDKHPYRIAVFGDSYVQALQVPEKDKFTARLEYQLGQLMSGERPVEVWNYAFAGDNTGTAYARWIYMASDIDFDAVIFSFNDGDPEENRPEDVAGADGIFLIPTATGYALQKPGGQVPHAGWMVEIKAAFPRLFYSQFLLRERIGDYISGLQDLSERIFPAAVQAAGNAHVNNRIDETASDAVRLANTVGQLCYIQAQIAERVPRVYLLAIPSHYSIAADQYPGMQRRRTYQALVEDLERACDRPIDPFLALHVAYRQGDDPYGVWEPGGHLNRHGHAILADVLADVLSAGQRGR